MPVVQPTGAVRSLTPGTYTDTNFSNDGSRLYAVAGNTVTVFNTADGSTIGSYTFGTKLGKIDISPDGLSLAVVEQQIPGPNGVLYLLDLATGTIATKVLAGTSTLYDVAFLADGDVMVSQTLNAPLKVFDLSSGASYNVSGSIPWYAMLTASADGTCVVARSPDDVWPIYSFDLDTGLFSSRNENPSPYSGASLPPPPATLSAVSPDGSLIVSGSTMKVYDTALATSFQLIVNAPDFSGIAGMTFSSDGTRLYLLASGTDKLFVIDTATWQVMARYQVGADVNHTVELRVSDDNDTVSIITAGGIQLLNLAIMIPASFPTNGDDYITEAAPNDRVEGLAGADYIDGGAGNDMLASHTIAGPLFAPVSGDIFAEHDVILGGDGSDQIFAGYGDDVDGGANEGGADSLFISFLGAQSGINVDFSQASVTVGGGTITGIEILRWVQGTDFDDTIVAVDHLAHSTGGTIVLGLGGNDHLTAGTWTSLLDGGDGDDVLDATLGGIAKGGAGNDTITTGYGTAYGDAGDDLITAKGEVDGGSGNDRMILIGSAPQKAFGGEGDDDITASSAGDYIDGGPGADTIHGGDGNDRIGFLDSGTSGTFAPDSGTEHDRLWGGGGNDSISVGWGDDADAGNGLDQLYLCLAGAPSGIVLDMAIFQSGNPLSFGGGTLQNFEYLSYLQTTEFADTLTLAYPEIHFDVFVGGGNDTVIANRGGFTVYGGEGDDTFISIADPYSYTNTFNGGAGSDTLNLANSYYPLKITISEGGQVDTYGISGYDVENLVGTAFDDNFIGNSLANVLEGRDGHDILEGNGGDDVLLGGTGQDALRGGSGIDTLTGGVGSDYLEGGADNDVFRDTASNLSGDTIADFAMGDRIVITDASLAGFTYALSGNTLSFTGGSLTLQYGAIGTFVASAAVGGGVELSLAPSFAGFGTGDLKLAAFGYGASAGGWQSDEHYPRMMADVNGDGRADVIGFGEAGVYVGLANNTGGFAPSFLARAEFGAGASAGGWISDDRYPRMMADVNGDHRADVVGFGENGVFVALGNGDGSFAPSTLAVAQWGAAGSAGGWSSNDRFLRTMADVNGDGRADIVGFGASAVYVSLANANGTFAPAKIASSGDFDSWVSDDRWPRELIDVNGDHREDIVGFGFDGVHVALANADGTFAPAILGSTEFGWGPGAGGWSSNELFHREVGDVNGDGFGDIVGFGANGVYVALATGNGTFAASHLDISAFGYSPSSGGWASQDHFPRHIADVNGDGAADILGFGDAGVYVAYSHGGI